MGYAINITINTQAFTPAAVVYPSLDVRTSQNMIWLNSATVPNFSKIKCVLNAGVFSAITLEGYVSLNNLAGLFEVQKIIHSSLVFKNRQSVINYELLHGLETTGVFSKNYFKRYLSRAITSTYEVSSSTAGAGFISRFSGSFISILGKRSIREYFQTNFWDNFRTGKKWFSKTPTSRNYYAGCQMTLTFLKLNSNNTYAVIKGITADGYTYVLNSYLITHTSGDYYFELAFNYSAEELSQLEFITCTISQDPMAVGAYDFTEIINFRVIKDSAFKPRSYKFRNQWGGFDTVITTGEITLSTEARKNSNTSFLSANAPSYQSNVLLTSEEIQNSFVQNSGFLQPSELEMFKEMIQSDEVFQIDTRNGLLFYLPIKITSSMIFEIDKIKQEQCRVEFKAEYLNQGNQ